MLDAPPPPRRRLRLALLSLALAAPPLGAQGAPLAELIPGLFDRTIVLAATGHQAHFSDASAELGLAGRQINASILAQLTSFPVGSSSGGFTYTFDPALGVMTRSSDSFGPIFSERVQTIGKGKWSFALRYLRFDYDSIDGLDLGDGDLALSFTHLDTNNDGTTVETVYEGDLIVADARLALSSDTTIVSANVGLAENLDLSVAIPVVRVELASTLATRIERLATEGYETPPGHLFPDGADVAVFSASGSDSGVGDVVVRGKWAFAREEGRGLAATLDVRLPTGDEENLLGSGATQIKLGFAGSAALGGFSPHANVGYAVYEGDDGPAGELPDEASFVAGFDWAVHPRVTVAADLLWRTLFEANQLQVRTRPHLYKPFDSTQIQTTQRPVLETEAEDLNLTTFSLGCKVNLWGQVLATVNLLYTASDSGLTDEDLVPLVGIETSF